MPMYDFRCDYCGNVFEKIVKAGVKHFDCPECGSSAQQVWLSAPHLDWNGMGASRNAGPEFINRFERSHKQRKEQEEAHQREHGDALRGAGG